MIVATNFSLNQLLCYLAMDGILLYLEVVDKPSIFIKPRRADYKPRSLRLHRHSTPHPLLHDMQRSLWVILVNQVTCTIKRSKPQLTISSAPVAADHISFLALVVPRLRTRCAKLGLPSPVKRFKASDCPFDWGQVSKGLSTVLEAMLLRIFGVIDGSRGAYASGSR